MMDMIVYLQEDIVDDATVLVDCARLLKANGAVKIYTIATHGVLSGHAPQLLMESEIDEVNFVLSTQNFNQETIKIMKNI